MAINSRNKGNRAERDLAKQIGEWTGKQFARVPSSGGLQWGAAHAKGDITCCTEGHYFPFCIEVKFHSEINLNEFMVGRKGKPKVLEFWEQCTRDAREAKKIPLLFMRYNGLPKGEWMVGMPISMATKLPLDPKELDRTMWIYHPENPDGLFLINSNSLFNSNYKTIWKFLKKNKQWLRKW